MRFKKLKQSCKFEPQNADEWYALIKRDMEEYAKIIDMGLDAWSKSLRVRVP
jgi:hypothetical protein